MRKMRTLIDKHGVRGGGDFVVLCVFAQNVAYRSFSRPF